MFTPLQEGLMLTQHAVGLVLEQEVVQTHRALQAYVRMRAKGQISKKKCPKGDFYEAGRLWGFPFGGSFCVFDASSSTSPALLSYSQLGNSRL